MPFIDTHCHLDDERIPGGDAAAIEAARAAGVVHMVCVGTDASRSAAALDIASRYDDVSATVGLHPHDAVEGIDSIVRLVDSPGVVAIGECGLDHHYDHSPREVQRAVFAAQVALANERDLPLVIHTREAWDETFDVLVGEGVPTRTIFHCFTGGPDEARRALDLGAYLSFSGIVSFPSAVELHEAARSCPSDRLLIETDSPYLAPVPHRGRPNHPALVVAVATALADLRGTSVDEIGAVTTQNAWLAIPGIAP
jgi:TatD DNase family protein